MYSDDTRFILDILAAARSYKQGSLAYDGVAGERGYLLDMTRSVQPDPNVEYYNSNSYVAGVLKAAGVENIPDPWRYQPGLDKPIPLP